MSEWLCINHYNELCKLKGVQDVEVCTISNQLGVECIICENIAEHLTVVSMEDIAQIFIVEFNKIFNIINHMYTKGV